jgi:hypothetical protein
MLGWLKRKTPEDISDYQMITNELLDVIMNVLRYDNGQRADHNGLSGTYYLIEIKCKNDTSSLTIRISNPYSNSAISIIISDNDDDWDNISMSKEQKKSMGLVCREWTIRRNLKAKADRDKDAVIRRTRIKNKLVKEMLDHVG